MSPAVLKGIGYVVTGAGVAIKIASDWVDKQERDKTIADEVEKQMAKLIVEQVTENN